MATLLQMTPGGNIERSISFGFEGARPRAATVSMCRYTVPQSPVCKPSAEPLNTPPSLILPPTRPNNSGLVRSLSKLSALEERLASSAPSTSWVLSPDSDASESVNSFVFGGRGQDQTSRTPEFSLLEEEGADTYRPYHSPAIQRTPETAAAHLVGMDDEEDSTPAGGGMIHEESPSESFGASPVLISCLRDIARMSRPN